ncbi:helix-turn-helix domain-containing protein [Ruegeria meonggei]|uniref:HTH-type transcriptional regulator CdhR n=1 Tax=Ruegeria meonggei TaxID=1446476 RepID=A0A1X7ACT5_9RHOB|nr:helix-turn-helix domain-containing protein [Ruegeria meonggei]SLN76137.1 HTH-type transcriptional regulator CdhR [Ruegeria meonggei]
MKHYVLGNPELCPVDSRPSKPGRLKHIEVILSDENEKASAEVVIEFYRALNTLIEDHTYVVNLCVPTEQPAGGPMYWSGRTAIFWGDLENTWSLNGPHKTWASQVLSQSPRSILVGGAIFVLARLRCADQTAVAVHPNFKAAALENGITSCGRGTSLAFEGSAHSAATRLSALKLLSEFVSIDHGEHLADLLRAYIGLSEPQYKHESQLATRLVRRAKGDQLILRVLDTMLDNIEDPIRISDLAAKVKTSTRQLQRQFLKKTGTKLLATYKELRLERAHSLLRLTDMTQIEISVATGFSSSVALARAFFEHYNTRPENIRTQRFHGNDGTLMAKHTQF